MDIGLKKTNKTKTGDFKKVVTLGCGFSADLKNLETLIEK